MDNEGRILICGLNYQTGEIVPIDVSGGSLKVYSEQKNHVCADNSSSVPLGAGESFVGEWEDCSIYGTAVIGVISDKASAVDGLKIEYSADGINVIQDDVFTISANVGKVFSVGMANKYLRVKYVNGSEAQGTFSLQTIFKSAYIKPSSHRISSAIIGEDDAELMKAVLTAEDENGAFVNIRAIQGQTGFNLKVSLDQIDESTNAVKTIDYSHAELHAGDHFFYTDAVELDSAAYQDYLITTPDTTKWAHFTFVVDGSAITQFQLFEATDKAGVTPATAFNNNRNSIKTPTITLHKGLSGGTVDGTQLMIYKSGSATNQSRGAAGNRNDQEINLKRNTKYILRVTSLTNDNLINVQMYWYEHTNI